MEIRFWGKFWNFVVLEWMKKIYTCIKINFEFFKTIRIIMWILIKAVGIRSINFFHRPIPMNGKLVITLDTDGCKGTPNYVRYLEHVQARITLTADRRGEVVIYLTSPSNTRSTLLARRERDYSREGFNNWAFMTTHNWGEEAEGRWFLQIENGASSCEFYD